MSFTSGVLVVVRTFDVYLRIEASLSGCQESAICRDAFSASFYIYIATVDLFLIFFVLTLIIEHKCLNVNVR